MGESENTLMVQIMDMLKHVVAESAVTAHAAAFLIGKHALLSGDVQKTLDEAAEAITTAIEARTARALADFTVEQNALQLARADAMMRLARQEAARS